MDDPDANRPVGDVPFGEKYTKEKMYKAEKSCACEPPVTQRFVCSRCLSTFSLLDGSLQEKMVSEADYQHPYLRLKVIFYFLIITACLIPILGLLQWNVQPKCSRCFNVFAQILGID